MMQTLLKPLRPFLLLVLLALIAVCWSAMQMSAAADRAAQKIEEHQRIERCVAALNRLDQQQGAATQSQVSGIELVQLIDAVARQCHLDPERQIGPTQSQPPQRLKGQPYAIATTRLTLKMASLESIVQMLDELRAEPRWLVTRQLRLQAPHDHVLSNNWNAEVVLQRLVYQPLEEDEGK